MSGAPIGGSRFLYAPFDAATARIDATERVLDERLAVLNHRLDAIEQALERLERRLWLALFGLLSVVVAQGINELLFASTAG